MPARPLPTATVNDYQNLWWAVLALSSIIIKSISYSPKTVSAGSALLLKSQSA